MSEVADDDQALAEYDRMIAEYPALTRLHEKKGFIFYQKGDLDAALAEWDLAWELECKR